MQEYIHYSDEFEELIIGSILMDRESMSECIKLLKPEMFYRPYNEEVYAKMESMFQEGYPIDAVTVSRMLALSGTYTFGVVDETDSVSVGYYLARTQNRIASTSNLWYWIRAIIEMYYEREIAILLGLGGEGKDVFAKVDSLRNELFGLMEKGKKTDVIDIDEALTELIQHMEKVKKMPLAGITTGWEAIDKSTGGMHAGEIIVVGARPGVGKSSFITKMMLAAANSGKNIVLFNMEMLNKEVMARIVSSYMDEDFTSIHRGRMTDEYMTEFLQKTVDKMSGMPIHFSDIQNLSITDIKANIIKLNRRNKIDCVYIDYLALLDVPKGLNKTYNREQEIAKISRQIKLLAMEFQIPIVVACQLNRLSEGRSSKVPILSDLRESGAIEQDASGVILLHRDYVSGITHDEQGASTEEDADIIIAKWRNGQLGRFKAKYEGRKMKFVELGVQTNQSYTPVRDITEPKKDEALTYFV